MSRETSGRDPQENILRCQAFLRWMTGVILGAFALIILMTTLSTGSFVQVSGRLLYYLIVLAALCSLGVWSYRIALEKRLGKTRG